MLLANGHGTEASRTDASVPVTYFNTTRSVCMMPHRHRFELLTVNEPETVMHLTWYAGSGL